LSSSPLCAALLSLASLFRRCLLARWQHCCYSQQENSLGSAAVHAAGPTPALTVSASGS